MRLTDPTERGKVSESEMESVAERVWWAGAALSRMKREGERGRMYYLDTGG